MLKDVGLFESPSNLNLYHSSNIETLSDYTIASGILIYLLIIIQRNGKSILIRLYKTVSVFEKGNAFNFLTTYVDYEADNLFYQKPEEIFDFVLKLWKKCHVNS